MKFLTVFLEMILFSGAIQAQQLTDSMDALTFQNAQGSKLPYRQYVTPKLMANIKIPLVLFLHGAGERGDDNALQLVHGVQPILGYCEKQGIAIALIAPQCPIDQRWVERLTTACPPRLTPAPTPSIQLVSELLADRCKALPIDSSRILVTGLSMGGYGTWDLLERNPDLFAAAIPVCGAGDSTLAWKVRKVPIWAFHGKMDSVVPVERTREMVVALWACRGNVRYREYPEGNHNVWDATYSDPTVLKWFFSQKRK